MSRRADLIAEHGDDTRIEWVHRDERYGEKLATPDTSIADLIGEVDPIKVAEGRYLSDELTMHYGLVPRTNRGIFAINELPDLAERIQVGLLNVLEERDVQVRGYKIRLPLDILLVASANPEDYTNRGRIITPLKDRFGSQIRTHYPLDVDTEVAIARQEAVPLAADGQVNVPDYMTEIVATLSHLARSSPHINQRSGVSVRFTISNHEVLVANATRRALRTGRPRCPRISDLEALAGVDHGQDRDRVARGGPRRPDRREPREGRCSRCSRTGSAGDLRRRHGVRRGRVVHAGEDVTSAEYVKLLASVPALREPVTDLTGGDEPAGWRRPPSSSSRACTCPSASTRTLGGAAYPQPRRDFAALLVRCSPSRPCLASGAPASASRHRPLDVLGLEHVGPDRFGLSTTDVSLTRWPRSLSMSLSRR